MREYKYKINGNEYRVAIEDTIEGVAHVKVNGVAYEIEMEKKPEAPKPVMVRPAAVATPVASAPTTRAASGAPGSVQAPLPGVIVAVKVNVGDEVTKGQELVVLEAMKMENTVCAESAGRVKTISVQKGDSVAEGAELVVIE